MMAVLINIKICDNVCECGGIESCPTGALFWDEKERKIGIDNSKCINCGACVQKCPVGAIKIAQTNEEYTRIKKEIEEDPRRISDLFIERYGAMPIDPDALFEEGEFERKIKVQTKPVLIEFFKEEGLQCLRRSIPIKELIKGEDIIFRKVRIENDERIKKLFGIKKFPCLCYFVNEKLRGKVEGFFSCDEKDKAKEKVDEVIKEKG